MIQHSECEDLLRKTVRRSDFLVVVPPCADWRRACLGPHLLQAIAARAGFDVQVLYANLFFSSLIPRAVYDQFIEVRRELMGERLFARSAHDLPPLGRNGAEYGPVRSVTGEEIEGPSLPEIEGEAARFVRTVARAIAGSGTRVVGCSTSFEQTNASLAILRNLKQLAPAVSTVLGGANCDGPMGEALLELAQDYVDVVCSGEADEVILSLLESLVRDGAFPGRVLKAAPVRCLDELPTPDFSDFLAQADLLLSPGERSRITLPYESSRGCWWGAKHHCTFCGLNGQGMSFRQKTAEVVFRDLQRIARGTGVRAIDMTDNIMPHNYFRSLLPALREHPAADLFYEIKANLGFEDVLDLKSAGVSRIQPGIEALSTPLLRLMRKGVGAPQNIALLRYARAAGVTVEWNLLVKMPGDQIGWYEDTMRLVPLIHHLQPPGAVFDISIQRFSPYFDEAEVFGIRDVRPLSAYGDVFPQHAAAERLAYYFDGVTGSVLDDDPELQKQIRRTVGGWRKLWAGDAEPPVLHVIRLDAHRYVLRDTRTVRTTEFAVLTPENARNLLTPARHDARAAYQQEAVAAGYATILDDVFVPLPTVDIEAATALGLIGDPALRMRTAGITPAAPSPDSRTVFD